MTDHPAFDYGVAAAAVESLSDVLWERRRRLRLTFREAAEQIGLSHATIDRMEQGEGFSAHSAVAVMRWLDTHTTAEEKS